MSAFPAGKKHNVLLQYNQKMICNVMFWNYFYMKNYLNIKRFSEELSNHKEN